MLRRCYMVCSSMLFEQLLAILQDRGILAKFAWKQMNMLLLRNTHQSLSISSLCSWGLSLWRNRCTSQSSDTIRIAQESCRSDDSLVQRFQGIVLLGVFLRLTPFQKDAGLSDDALFERVEVPIEKYFGKRGAAVVRDNVEAARKGFKEVFEVPREIIDATPADVLEQGRLEWEAKGKDTNAFFI